LPSLTSEYCCYDESLGRFSAAERACLATAAEILRRVDISGP
jgi:hypothetical protein